MTETNEAGTAFAEVAREHIEKLRPKVLDLTARNRLIATHFSERRHTHIRIVDELPGTLLDKLAGSEMEIDALPPLEKDPPDEQSGRFRRTLSEYYVTDETYLAALKSLEDETLNDADREQSQAEIDRELKDRVREALGMPARQKRGAQRLDLAAHAKLHGIRPDYELPLPSEQNKDGRHSDNHIQTLLLQERLERRCNTLISRANSAEQEYGIQVLHCATGFLEWQDERSDRVHLSPLLLLAVSMRRKKTERGMEFRVTAEDNAVIGNTALMYRFRNDDYGIDLPQPEASGSKAETYFERIGALKPKGMRRWRVHRYAAIGIFPSVSQAMYEDLDTEKWDISDDALIVRVMGSPPGGGQQGAFSEDYAVDNPEVERDIPLTVLDADSSQLSALVDVARGEDLALEGPPGTGKSQTIVNAIAAALAQGKKVLFAAEKLAALEVVRSRLEERGLGEFVLSLQAGRSDAALVKRSLEARLKMPDASRLPDGSPKLDESIRAFRAARAELARYIELMSQPFYNTGLTKHEILGRAIVARARTEHLPRPLRVLSLPDAHRLTQTDYEDLCDQARRYVELIEGQGDLDPGWRFIQTGYLDPFRVEQTAEAARELAPAHGEYWQARQALVRAKIRPEADPDAQGALVRWTGEEEQALQTCAVERLRALLDTELREHYLGFEQRLRRHHTLTQALGKIRRACEPLALAQRLSDAAGVMTTYGLSGLDPTLVEAERTRKSPQHMAAEAHLAEFDRLVGDTPALHALPGRALERAASLLSETPSEVLEQRFDSPLTDDDIYNIKELSDTVKALNEAIEKASKTFAWSALPSRKTLTRHLNALRVSSRWSRDYWRARKAVKALMVNPGQYRRAGIADQLFRLTVLQRKVDQVEDDARFAGHPWFKGFATDFAQLDRLIAFQRRAESLAARLETPALGSFLLESPAESVLTLQRRCQAGALEGLAEQTCSLREVQALLKAERARQSERAAALSSLSPLKDELGLDEREAEVAGPEQLRQWAAALSEHSELDDALRGDGRMRELLQDAFEGTATRPGLAETEARLAESLHAFEEPIRTALLVALRQGELQALRTAMAVWLEQSSCYANKVREFEQRVRADADTWGFDPFAEEAGERFLALGEDERGLDGHARRNTHRRKLAATAAGPLLNALEGGDLAPAEFVTVLQALLDRSRAAQLYERHGEQLGAYRGDSLERQREALATYDKRIIELSHMRLRKRIAERAAPPPGNAGPRVRDKTEMALLCHELSKKRIAPARTLTARAGAALREIKPCWMMSPLTVAKYLPRIQGLFDLVVVDEASQMRPENALGALLRGKQALIVGDTQQLPPTPYFKNFVGSDDDEDEDDGVPQESILNIANLTLPKHRRLRWHYRSRHGSLIAFSNYHMYDNELLVFPSPRLADERLGVKRVSVSGAYQKRINVPEAGAIIEHVLRHMAEDPRRSLGVVVMNNSQQELLEEQYRAASQDNSATQAFEDYWTQHDDGIERFFIKNLENVQGDQRDVIFIGTVYGPDKDTGRVFQRFTAINGRTGQRRLNVLFSRAKEQVVTFTSLAPNDLRIGPNGNQGVAMLKQWLEYAATGQLERGIETGRGPDSPFEEHVIRCIEGMGFEAVPQVGVAGYYIDIGVRHPHYTQGFLLGVECDGASYHSGRSARDRDRLRQEVLEDKGWALHRIWSTDWFADPRGQAQRLREVMEQRLAQVYVADLHDADEAQVFLPKRARSTQENKAGKWRA